MAAALLAAGAIDEVKDCCHCVPVETKMPHKIVFIPF
jgi:hypothetical protein